MSNHDFADLVLTNGIIYTVDDRDSVEEAVAIKEGRILFIGAAHQVEKYIGAATVRIDLQGKMVIPGMIDTHIHPPGLSLSELYEVHLTGIKTFEGYLAAVQQFITDHPDAKLVYGRGWSWGLLQGEELVKGPRKEYLDAITTEIPIALRADDGHTLWVNSKAFTANGITTETVVPAGGEIPKDPVSGELWGTLKEWAMGLIALPEYSLEQYLEGMAAFQAKMHRLGITGILCLAGPTFPLVFKTFTEMQKNGQLELRIRGAVTINAKDDLGEQFTAIRNLQAQLDINDLKITTAKFFTDGVIEGGTGFLLEPYTLETGKGAGWYGTFLWDTDKLQQAFAGANQAGLQIHVHSTGDASTRKVLDALEGTKARVSDRDYRNTITHLQLVDPLDIQRMKELGVVASVQPYWQFKTPNWWQSVDYRVLGERAEREYPLKSLFDAGLIVTASSDYPVTPVPNPFLAIEIGVTRNMAQGSMYGLDDITDADDPTYLLNPNERVGVKAMIRSFTKNGAYCVFMEEAIGSIEVGKLADLVVLDRNLFAIDPIDIDQTEVLLTIFNGKIVYQKI